MFEVSERLKNVKVSASAAMTRKVRELRAEGVKIVGLSSGEPDFPTPAPIVTAAVDAIKAGKTHYTQSLGLPELRAAIAGSVAAERSTLTWTRRRRSP